MIRYSNIDSISAVRWCFSNTSTRMKVNQTSSQHSIVATCPDLIAIFLNYYSMKIYTIYTSATMQVNLRTTQQLSRLIIIHCSCSIYLEVIRIKKSFQVANHKGPFQHDKANTEQRTCIINSGHEHRGWLVFKFKISSGDYNLLLQRAVLDKNFQPFFLFRFS